MLSRIRNAININIKYNYPNTQQKNLSALSLRTNMTNVPWSYTTLTAFDNESTMYESDRPKETVRYCNLVCECTASIAQQTFTF